uniref:Kinesin-like protein n=1 Tax=Rhizophora mucronata TaxID=61149 RepID=A0A2P2KCH7_RHIMU
MMLCFLIYPFNFIIKSLLLSFIFCNQLVNLYFKLSRQAFIVKLFLYFQHILNFHGPLSKQYSTCSLSSMPG